ncbi:unnamed protein product [Spirodela intermedia]|uniref:Uncharacterized protein n=1 Tax=Spirodela intermedia TaxID=51605 RepID=A0A7I8L999_SPIIN|nr:unnamed protein product [Spirodela intermedia]
MWAISRSPLGKWQLCSSPVVVTHWREARWRWGGAHVRELHPQVRAARGGSSSHLQCSANRVDEIFADDPAILIAESFTGDLQEIYLS